MYLKVFNSFTISRDAIYMVFISKVKVISLLLPKKLVKSIFFNIGQCSMKIFYKISKQKLFEKLGDTCLFQIIEN